MKNFSKKELADLKKSSELLHFNLNNASDWISNNLKFEERIVQGNEIKISRSDTHKICNSMESKPVFALFGASQVGKSYLVKNLISIEGAPLKIAGSDREYDFLKEINPQGSGAESTGVVTRFALREKINSQFPIEIKLLTPKDIVIILCDSFFSDILKMDNYPNITDFESECENLLEKYSNSNHNQENFTEDDIWDIKGYFTKNFNKFSHYVNQIEDSNFWTCVGPLISKVPSNQWVSVFTILWNKNQFFDELFVKLIRVFDSIDFQTVVYAPFDVVLREKGMILDVKRLSGILNDDVDPLDIKLLNDKLVSIGICQLSAITAELNLPIAESIGNQKEFLKTTDLLDFPGARGRLQLKQEHINRESCPNMFLRGKVAYLFNRYSGNYEINNLLFCMHDAKLEVNELPSILFDWIQTNVGRDIEEREKRIGSLPQNPLFLVFTFFNKQLDFNKTNDLGDLNYKWKNRFNTFFENEFVTTKYDWDKNWTVSKSLFNNFYLLRDFEYSNDVFSGFDESKKENGIHEYRKDYFKRLKESFLSFPFVQSHFEDPQEMWGESASPAKDGSNLILDRLKPAANNFIKTKNYIEKLAEHKQKCVQILQKHAHSDDLGQKRNKAFRDGNDIHIGLNSLFDNPNVSLGMFINDMSVKETVVFNFLQENFLKLSQSKELDSSLIFKRQHPDLNSSMSKEDNLSILKDDFKMESIDEVNSYLQNNNIDIEKVLENKVITSATRLVDGVLELWFKSLEIDNFSVYAEYGLKTTILNSLVENLVNTFEILNVRNILIDLFEKKTRMIEPGPNAIEYLAHVSSNYINEFVASFGMSFMSDERLEGLNDLGRDFDLDLSLLNEQTVVLEKSLIDIFDSPASVEQQSIPLIENYSLFILKVRLALLSNCGFASYNVESNNELMEIINNIEELEFKIEDQ
tara:strand:+ start:4125 stop:6893 length:2769 start_codon:yes stop_codon:yes gene_type:complete